MSDEEEIKRPKIKFKNKGIKKRNTSKVKRKRPMPVTEVGGKVKDEPVPKKRKYKKRNTVDHSLPEYPLDNTRWEIFAQNLAVGMSKIEAYRNAGFNANSASSNSSVLAKKPSIAARVSYIQKNMVENRHAVIMAQSKDLAELDTREAMLELGITKAYLLAHLQNNVVLAQQEGQISASNKAIAMLWSVLNEGNPGDPDAKSGPNKNEPVSLNVLLNFAEKLDEKPNVTIIEDDDIRLVADDDLKDVSDDVSTP